MRFEQLIAKVEQAEAALEAQGAPRRRRLAPAQGVVAEAWTPGRIVIAGLVSGFLVGRAEPCGGRTSGSLMQLATMLSGLFAGGSAQVAAGRGGAGRRDHRGRRRRDAVAPGADASADAGARRRRPSKLHAPTADRIESEPCPSSTPAIPAPRRSSAATASQRRRSRCRRPRRAARRIAAVVLATLAGRLHAVGGAGR